MVNEKVSTPVIDIINIKHYTRSVVKCRYQNQNKNMYTEDKIKVSILPELGIDLKPVFEKS